MDFKGFGRCRVSRFKWIFIFIVFHSSITFGENNSDSHKTTPISHIPWNMLLDPNYTSHNYAPKPNRTSFTPSQTGEYSPPFSFSYQQHSSNLAKDSASPGVYYVPTPAAYQLNQNHGIKFSSPFLQNEHKIKGSISSSATAHRHTEKILFPSASNIQVNKPISGSLPHYIPPPEKQKSKKTTQIPKSNDSKKQKKRKPDDYFNIDDEDEDYIDSYYQDYDYMENERETYKPSKQSFHFTKKKEVGDPFGLLPSASDPDGFFAKAKDLLRGGTHSKPSYSSSGNYYSNYSPNYSPNNSPNYSPNYTPNKHYEDTAPYGGHGGHSYYDQENVGYPQTEDHYGSPGYDFDTSYGDGNYGGIIPYPDRRKGSKYGPLAFALGLLPLGLLIASLVPTVVTIPVTTAVATGRRRKRSVQFVNPVIETISEYGVRALEDPSCLNRIFCQVVRDGNKERSSIVQKLYFKIANVLDEKIAAYVGLKHLLLAVRKDECELFQCNPQKPSDSN